LDGRGVPQATAAATAAHIIDDTVAQFVERTRASSGVPALVADPVVIALVARILRAEPDQ
jgi:hypothetical protein